jgi:hypothetical protein
MFNMVLWAAFFMSVVMYQALILADIIPQQSPAQPGGILGYIFLFLGIFQLLVIINADIFYVGKPRRISLNIPGLQDKPPAHVEQLVREAKAGHYRIMFIMMCALAEAVGIYGLLVYLLGGEKLFAHILMGIAYLGLIYIWLRARSCWEAMYLE